MLNKAAIAFAKLYSIEKAQQNGFQATHPHLQASQAADRIGDLTQNFFDYGLELATINKDLMSQLQEDPTNTQNECYDKTAAMNAQILSMADLELYILEGFDMDKMIKSLKVAEFKLEDQVNACMTQEGLMYGLPRAQAIAMQWAEKVWNEGQEEKDIIAPKVSAGSKSVVNQIMTKLQEQDYSSLIESASMVKEAVQSNDNYNLVASKMLEVVNDEGNRQKLDRTVQMGVSQISKASVIASETLASHAGLY